MAEIETYYLIDFENVKEDNLLGGEKLGACDQVHIFSTENVPKISIRLLSVFNSTKVFSHVVAVGKQSLDMHLVSYLGFLLGKNEKARYVIISQDTDYDNVIAFWKKRLNCDIKRQNSMGGKPARALLGKTVNKAEKNKTNKNKPENNKAEKSKVKPRAAQNKVQLNNEIQKILAKAGFDKEIIGYVASLCISELAQKNAKQNIYRDIVAKYGQKQGLNIYNHIKQNI